MAAALSSYHHIEIKKSLFSTKAIYTPTGSPVKAMVLEYQVTDFSINLLKAQDGFLIVGDGYTITKVTVGQ